MVLYLSRPPYVMEKTLQSIEETNRLILIQLQKLDALGTNQKKLKYQIHAVGHLIAALIEGVAYLVTTSQIIHVLIIITVTLHFVNFCLALRRLGNGYFWKE